MLLLVQQQPVRQQVVKLDSVFFLQVLVLNVLLELILLVVQAVVLRVHQVTILMLVQAVVAHVQSEHIPLVEHQVAQTV